MYKAHINDITKEIQTVKQHSENTAKLCREFAVSELKNVMYVMGLLHDVGKYQNSFQKRIDGENIKVEHSSCGAADIKKEYKSALGFLMAYCIAGHHSGIPDGGYCNDTPDLPTLYGRTKRTFEDYSVYRKELNIPKLDEMDFMSFLAKDCENDMNKLIDKFSFFTRYCFSCLTDADSIDTAEFCNGSVNKSLKADFEKCLEKTNNKFESFVCKTPLQKARAYLQNQVFEKANINSEIYLLNMPTGSGKTLCSVKFALERALKSGKKRIIYIIPYNSIIDQTAEVFEKLFGNDAEILRHQSTFSFDDYEDCNEDYRKTVKLASENWDAGFIITTAVQFFESVYANKRGKLRKLHNMADSILIFDEAHLMPRNYLQPCLEAISYITKYLNSEAVFLTATMPDYKDLIKTYAVSESQITDLIDDTSEFEKFNKCNYKYLGELGEEKILETAQMSPSSLIVVNKRSTAKKLFSLCRGKKYHLSTYMTSYDRKRVINEIKSELLNLEKDYPDFQNVPDERRIVVVSTSLIEAGVDLDFYTVFREMTGLDSILQAGGRCNREGKRKKGNVYIFDFESERGKISGDERANITKGLIMKYKDISCSQCISEYFERLFFAEKEEITKNSMNKKCNDIRSVPFKKYAEDFDIIDSKTISVAVSQDENSRNMIEELRNTKTVNTRKLQKYTFSIYQYEFDNLYKQNAVDDFESGVWCLTNPDYYDRETGITFEAQDYFI